MFRNGALHFCTGCFVPRFAQDQVQDQAPSAKSRKRKNSAHAPADGGADNSGFWCPPFKVIEIRNYFPRSLVCSLTYIVRLGFESSLARLFPYRSSFLQLASLVCGRPPFV